MNEQYQFASLEDFESYLKLSRKLQFAKAYWYVVVSVPLVLAIFIGVRFFNNSENHIGNMLIAVSLCWGFLVCVYGLVLLGRFLMFRCPRCGWRFGLGESCGSCTLPRRRLISPWVDPTQAEPTKSR